MKVSVVKESYLHMITLLTLKERMISVSRVLFRDNMVTKRFR